MGCSVVVSIVMVVLIWYFVVPQYKSTAIVRVAPVRSRLVFSTETNKMVPLYRNYLNTQVSTIRSPRVLRRALDRKNVQETQWYREGGKRFLRDALPPLDRLAKELAVQPGRDSELIEVSIAVSKGSEAKLLVDAVVDEYDKLMTEREKDTYVDIIEKVRDRYRTLENQTRGLQETRYNLSKDLGVMDSVELREQLSGSLSELESRLMEVERELAILKARRTRSGPHEEGGSAPGSGAETQAGSETSEPAPSEETLAEKELERTLLRKDIDRQREKVKKIREIARYEEQTRRAQQEFEDVRRRLTELRTEAKAPGRISIASDGVQPSQPDEDQRVPLTVLALLLPVIIGVLFRRVTANL